MSKKTEMTWQKCIKVLKEHSKSIKDAIKESEEVLKSESVIATGFGQSMINDMIELKEALEFAIAELKD